MSTQRVLTGITTTGSPHLGNYVGAIRPAIAASRRDDVQSFFFLADYHALVKCEDPERVSRSTLEIAASWLACGLDPERVHFYRQSDIPEIPELTWILACNAGKGLLNRAHAYKAAVDANGNDGDDPDAGITMGLFSYPVLMAADILAFNAHRVPVGRDQIQHIEMARDMAARFNHRYGEHFQLPEAQVDEQVATLPGLDGRKMSKSYDNTIPLWLPEKALKAAIARIVTDSRAPGEAKDTDGSALFEIYRAFATPSETQAMRDAYAGGIGWGEAKQALFERINGELKDARERYYQLVSRPGEIEEILRFGGRKARALVIPLVSEVRMATGIAPLFAVRLEQGGKIKTEKDAQPRFVSFRDDGGFRFKLLDEHGELVLESVAFDSPQRCGQAVGVLKKTMLDRRPDMLVPGNDDGFELKTEDGVTFAKGTDVERYRQTAEIMAVLLA